MDIGVATIGDGIEDDSGREGTHERLERGPIACAALVVDIGLGTCDAVEPVCDRRLRQQTGENAAETRDGREGDAHAADEPIDEQRAEGVERECREYGRTSPPPPRSPSSPSGACLSLLFVRSFHVAHGKLYHIWFLKLGFASLCSSLPFFCDFAVQICVSALFSSGPARACECRI